MGRANVNGTTSTGQLSERGLAFERPVAGPSRALKLVRLAARKPLAAVGALLVLFVVLVAIWRMSWLPMRWMR
jgi:hypothetical protein